MPWGTIDDAFDEHPKVEQVLDCDDLNPLMGLAAMGLWGLAFSWAHRNTRRKGKTPGLIPTATLRRWVPRANRDDVVRQLVEARLWDEHPDGWVIHNFVDYLPSAKTREERSAAGKKGAAARWGGQSSDGDTDAISHDSVANAWQDDGNVEATSWQDDGNLPSSDGKPHGNLPSDDGKPHGKNGSRAHPVPSTHTQTPKSKDQNPTINAPRRSGAEIEPGTDSALIPINDIHTASVKRASRDAQFDEFWKPYPRKVGKQGARKVWDTKVRNGADPDAIAAGAVAFAGHVRTYQIPEDKTPHPSTWLNAGRWEDQLPGPPSTAIALRDGRPPSAALPGGRTLNRKTAQHVNHLAAYGDDPDA